MKSFMQMKLSTYRARGKS